MVNGHHWESPVLRSVLPVVGHSQHVATSAQAVDRVAYRMANEAFAFAIGGAAGEFDLGSDPQSHHRFGHPRS